MMKTKDKGGQIGDIDNLNPEFVDFVFESNLNNNDLAYHSLREF
jgi:hypothetical protein